MQNTITATKNELELKKYKILYPTIKKKIDITKTRISKALEKGKFFVEYSFGKDSTVLAHLCNIVCPGIFMMHTYHDESIFMYDLDGLMKHYEKIYNIKSYYFPTLSENENFFVDFHNRKRENKELLADIKDYSGFFKGIRAGEAKYRRHHINNVKGNYMIHEYEDMNKKEKYKNKEGEKLKYSCMPLGDREEKEILIYIAYHNLKYQTAYLYGAKRTSSGLIEGYIEEQLTLIKRENQIKFRELIEKYPFLGKYK